jgi:hypothetical protein
VLSLLDRHPWLEVVVGLPVPRSLAEEDDINLLRLDRTGSDLALKSGLTLQVTTRLLTETQSLAKK